MDQDGSLRSPSLAVRVIAGRSSPHRPRMHQGLRGGQRHLVLRQRSRQLPRHLKAPTNVEASSACEVVRASVPQLPAIPRLCVDTPTIPRNSKALQPVGHIPYRSEG